FDDLWDFADPAATEQRFRDLLADPRVVALPSLGVEIETQIARTLGLRRRFDEARAVLDAAQPRIAPASTAPAATPDIARARVRWLLERGRTHASGIHADDPAAAMALYVEAFDLARAIGEERLAIDAAHMAAIVAADPARQERWNLDALALAESATDPKARRWRGSLLNNLGMAYHDAGRYDDALHAFERLREVREAAGDPSAVFIAWWMIAWTLRFLGRHEEALAILDRLHADATARGAPDGYVCEELAENTLAMGDERTAIAWFVQAYRFLADEPSVRADAARLERLRAFAARGEAAT
ncbi:MAG: tetratricopeptide repeat protein, partial [Ardenticatenales bacterium]